MDKYFVTSLIGEGSFGRVFKATEKSSKNVVALKVIGKRGRSTKELKCLRRECDIQSHLCHPNIIQMLESFETKTEIVVVTEYARGDLHTLLAREGSIGEPRTQKLTFDLVSALYYLHSHRILHRDLKPQNILLDQNEHAKLCDFGLARNMTMGTHVLTSIKGTPLYMAPELMSEKPYDHLADLWSLGCIIYETLAGQPPFCTTSILQLVRLIRHEDVKWPSFLTDTCISFLQGLLEKDPALRMTWTEILNHSFVKGQIIILNEDIPESPFTNPLTASQSREKERQAEWIMNGGASKCQKQNPCLIPGISNVSLISRKTPKDDDIVSSRDSIHAVLQSDLENIETDVEELMLKNQTPPFLDRNLITNAIQLESKSMPQEDICFVSGNTNLIINHFNDNFPQTSVQEEDITEIATNKLNTNPMKNQKITKSKSKNSQLEKRKLSQNLENFSLRLNQSVDTEKVKQSKNTLTQEVSYSLSQLNINKKKLKNVKEDVVDEADTPERGNTVKNPPDMPPGWDSCDDSQNPPIENEEWLAFIHRTMQEVLDGELDSLKQQNLISIIVAPLRNSKTSCKVVESVAQLLCLPLILGGPPSILANIRTVYIEVKLVPNLVYASKLLCCQKNSNNAMDSSSLVQPNSSYICKKIIDLSSEEIKTISCLYELVCHLLHMGDSFLSQFCDALAILGANNLFVNFISEITDDPNTVRLINSILAILCCALRELPENADLIEKIIFHENVNLINFLKHNNDLLRYRTCMLLRLLGRFSCYTLQNNWSIKLRDTLEALMYDSEEQVRNEAESALEEFKHLSFYVPNEENNQ